MKDFVQSLNFQQNIKQNADTKIQLRLSIGDGMFTLSKLCLVKIRVGTPLDLFSRS